MNDSSSELRNQDKSNSDVWGTGMKRRLAKRAGIDLRLINKLDEPIELPSVSTIRQYINKLDGMIDQLTKEKKKCETEKRNATNLICNGFVVDDTANANSMNSLSEGTINDQITRIWEENKLRHIESERKLLYPGSEHLTHEINIQHIIHKNSVDYSQHRVYLVPIIRKQEIERRNHYSTIKNKYKRLVAEWNLTHHDDDDSSSSRGWKEDDSKRDKRSITARSMSRITRSQTNNMVEGESITKRDPEYFHPRQADVNRFTNLHKDKYQVLNHNNQYTSDGKPMVCQDIPRNQPCPSHCNCPYQMNETRKRSRPWTDMEKFIFLNSFFTRPKDFRYIASTLTNRSVQDVIDFYYLNKRGMYVKLLLRIQLSMWKNSNYDSRPLLLVAAYGIGLPIPEEVFCKNYASYDISQYIKDDHVSILNGNHGLKSEDEMLLKHPDYHYDIEENEHISRETLKERKIVREKRIEQLLRQMGVDLKNCIPAEEKEESTKENQTKEKEKINYKQILGSDEEERSSKRRRVNG